MRFIFFCLLISFTSQGQTFMKTYGGEKFDRALFLTHTSDKGYLACGYSNSFGDNYDMYLVKVDGEGSLQWQKNYGGTKMDLGWSVHELSNGWLLHGSTVLEGALVNQDICLMRLDQQGNVLWKKTYGGEKEERTTDLIIDSDGNYLLMGHRVIKDTTDLDSYFIKVDTSGNVIWEKTFGGPLRERAFYGTETKQGDYLVSGSILPYDNRKADLLFLRINKQGELLWSKTIGDKGIHEISHSFLSNSNGRTHTATGYIETALSNHDAFFIQIDDKGKELRRTRYHSGKDMRMMHAEETADKGFIVTGYILKDSTDDAVLLKYDRKGNVEWMRTFGSPGVTDQGYWVVCNDDGGYTLTGFTHSYGIGGDLWLIRTDRNGEVK